MSAQFDFLPSTDVSALSSLSLSQLQQLVARLAPLSNIGFIYVGTARPNITNNPRMIRYIWMDITDPAAPVFKRYIADRTVLVDLDASWTAEGVSADAILNTMIADDAVSVLNSTGANKIALRHDAAADLSKALFIARIGSAGQNLEVVSLASILTTGVVPLIAIAKGGSDGQVLVLDSTNPSGAEWAGISGDSITSLPITKLSVGAAGFLLRTNTPGATAAEWVDDSDIIPTGTAAAALQVPQRNAANNATGWATPIFSKYSGIVVGAASLNTTGLGGLETIAHTLAATPTLYKIYLRCLSGGVGEGDWVTNDEVPIEFFHEITTGTPAGASYADATNIYFRICNDILRGQNKLTGAAFSITLASWRMIIKAWL